MDERALYSVVSAYCHTMSLPWFVRSYMYVAQAKAYAPGLRYDPISRICTWQQIESRAVAPRLGGRLLILAAGTADTRVAKEALQVYSKPLEQWRRGRFASMTIIVCQNCVKCSIAALKARVNVRQ